MPQFSSWHDTDSPQRFNLSMMSFLLLRSKQDKNTYLTGTCECSLETDQKNFILMLLTWILNERTRASCRFGAL